MSNAKEVSGTVAMPQPGDLIEVTHSTWYAVKDGERALVSEPSWVRSHGEFTIVPRKDASAFYGPSHGPATFTSRDTMSTSGGPFKTLHVGDVELEYVGETMNHFWCWIDRPRAGGGQEYERKVSLWRMSMKQGE